MPLHVCEARDPKGLYKLARDGKIKGTHFCYNWRQRSNFISYISLDKRLFGYFTAGFTGIDDPYEPPLDCEVCIQLVDTFHQFCVLLRENPGNSCFYFYQIILEQKGLNCPSPFDMAEEVVSYLEEKGYLEA